MTFLNYHNWSLKRKLSAIVLFTSGLLIALMAIAVSVEKHYSYRARLVENRTVLADIIGANSTAAITFKDTRAAQEILAALKAEKDIMAAGLYDSNGDIIVSYVNDNYVANDENICQKDNLQDKDISGPHFKDDHFRILRPIQFIGKNIGYIELCTDLTFVNKQLQLFLLVITLFSLLLFVVGILICARLNRSIIDPVSRLSDTMQEVTEKQNFDLRVAKQYEDEIGVLIDGFNSMISQLAKRDSELEEYREHLEEIVETRTTELKKAHEQLLVEIDEREKAQTQLVHAQKMEAIGTLAGGVAHDLNNILSGVVSYPDYLLLDLPEDSTLIKPLETIRNSGIKAAAIVQDLLTLARRGLPVAIEIDLQNIVIDYLASLECIELQKNHDKVKIVFKRQPESFLMNGSPVHLSKTIMNLVANGIEAMPEGGTLEISLAKIYLDYQPVDFSQWQEGEYIRLSISDTGIGIPKENLGKIYEPFYTSKVMGRSGTGLGMAVVWGTVEDHKGYITVASEEGRGTTFQLFFPIVQTQIPTIPHQTEPEEDEQYGRGQTILVVDDSEQQRQIAAEILNRLGYAPTVVASGEEAIEYIKVKPVDLILLDMLMPPGINGLETYKQILVFRPNQKAIIASGYSRSAPIKEARALGVSEYVLKPYSVRQIGQAVSNALSNS